MPVPSTINEKDLVSRSAAKAAIVLGIIGCDFPELLSHR
jgi:hypothetical protein